jgi:hypothetical protein
MVRCLHDCIVSLLIIVQRTPLINRSVLIPWVTLREVPVEVEIPSPKVAVLKFERGMQQGLLGRISRTSIMEYHAFGIISQGRKASCHYMICGVQGDFTKNLVANPPKTVWTRELKFGTSSLAAFIATH